MYKVKTDSESITLQVAASHRIPQYFPQDDEKSLLKHCETLGRFTAITRSAA